MEIAALRCCIVACFSIRYSVQSEFAWISSTSLIFFLPPYLLRIRAKYIGDTLIF
jgi:hypothetical protein